MQISVSWMATKDQARRCGRDSVRTDEGEEYPSVIRRGCDQHPPLHLLPTMMMTRIAATMMAKSLLIIQHLLAEGDVADPQHRLPFFDVFAQLQSARALAGSTDADARKSSFYKITHCSVRST